MLTTLIKSAKITIIAVPFHRRDFKIQIAISIGKFSTRLSGIFKVKIYV